MQKQEVLKLPRPFVLRRLHSLLGVWLVIYLFEHLLVNSQIALFLQDEGSSFVRLVNKIHSLPFLRVVEVLFLGIPFLIHGLWGIKYALQAKFNSFRTEGSAPSLPHYPRNRAFTWQRLSSWILLVGILGHVVQMRFIHYPIEVEENGRSAYFVRVEKDANIFLVAAKLQALSYTRKELEEQHREMEALREQMEQSSNQKDQEYYKLLNLYQERMEWIRAAEKRPLKGNQILLVAPSAGSAFLIIVRETFKSPLMVILYSIFVLVASYHAFNGLWTSLITWGVTLTRHAQNRMRLVTTCLMSVVAFLGLMSIWGTYWIFQFQG